MFSSVPLLALAGAATLGIAAAAAPPRATASTDGTAVYYDEPTGRYCLAFDAITGSRPPHVECRTAEVWTQFGVAVSRR